MSRMLEFFLRAIAAGSVAATLAGCASLEVGAGPVGAGFPTGDPVRGDANLVASSAPGGKSLVCRLSEGSCFAAAPLQSGTSCACIADGKVVQGTAGGSIPAGTEANLSSAVTVYFATDRKVSASATGVDAYGAEKGPVSYGVARVSIPATHQTGYLEAPSQMVRIRFLENTAKHVLVADLHRLDRDPFFASVEGRVRSSARSEAFVFVHGFNVNFNDALRRTAQLAFDLGFEGAPILYSWPSRGSPSPIAYTNDSQTVEWSKELLKEFLQDLLQRSSAANIYLIAHSMGNRPLTSAFISVLNEKPEWRQRIREVILAAPDIPADIFKRDLVPALARQGRPVTLYASSKDRALLLSKIPNGGPRAGDAGSGLVLVDAIETVDASSIDTDFLGHSYFADTRDLLLDLQALLRQGLRASQRPGLRQINSSTPYWEFRR